MDAKPKLLVVTPLYPPEIGGPATYVRFLEDHLPQKGIVPDVVRFGYFKRLPYIVRHIALFLSVFRHAKYADIVYALDPLGVGLPSALAAKLRGKKFFLRIAGDRAWETASADRIGESLDDFSQTRAHPFRIRLMQCGETLCANMAEKIVTPGFYLKKIVSNWGVSPEKIFPIYNAFAPVDIPEEKEQLRNDLGLSSLAIVSAGRLVKWKGFDTLIRAMPGIVREFPDAVLYIIGDGPERESLSCAAEAESMTKHVLFLGNLPKEDLCRHIKASDLFVLNTYYEGFSHQILEAMSLETPVIATTSGGNPELIETGKDGLLVTFDDSLALASTIFLLLGDRNRAENLAKKGKEKSRKFGVERAVSELFAVFSSEKKIT